MIIKFKLTKQRKGTVNSWKQERTEKSLTYYKTFRDVIIKISLLKICFALFKNIISLFV